MLNTAQQPLVNLSDVAFYGRHIAHFQEMFAVRAEELYSKRVLDIATGPSLYPDDLWRKFKVNFKAVDPAYSSDENTLLSRSNSDAVLVTNAYRNSGVLDESLEAKLNQDELLHQTIGFLSSLAREFRCNKPESAPEYVADRLPKLELLLDDKYDLVTCGHLLFAYFDPIKRPWLDKQFHIDSLNRLIELSLGEVRIYPTKTLSGNEIPFMDELIDLLSLNGHSITIEQVPHNHVKYWDKMLRIIPAHSKLTFDIRHTKESLWNGNDPWRKVYE